MPNIMPKSQRETYFEEITPTLGKRVLNKSKLKDKMKSNKNILFLYYFLGFAFFFTFSSFNFD